jgi:putative tryptophan/tyrosine transport system substrate-binding protein
MDRRTFLAGTGSVLLAAPIAAEAQPTTKVWRIGYLSPAAGHNSIDEVFERSMTALGYIEGNNVQFERRYTRGHLDQFSQAAVELARLNVDAIVVWSPAATAAVKNATKTIPVVFLAGGAAVESGLVAGLAGPRENLTGITYQANRTLGPKYFELLKDLIPNLRSVAVLRVPEEDPSDETQNYETTARALGIGLRQVALHRPEDLQSALADIKRGRSQALVGAPSGLLWLFRKEIADFAAQVRLPAVYGLREVTEVGGLMSISPNLVDIAARGAVFVDKILKGVKPADLPVEQPTKIELIINLKTAKAFGLTIPPTLLMLADEVIRED